ncbi:MAG: nitroreductase family protein [Chloroflexota bacterium]
MWTATRTLTAARRSARWRESVAMAAQTLWLTAHAAGLGACWLCAPLFVPELVVETLQLPLDWEPQGLLTLGWPAEEKENPALPGRAGLRFWTGDSPVAADSSAYFSR